MAKDVRPSRAASSACAEEGGFRVYIGALTIRIKFWGLLLMIPETLF